jgi:hypothetical protein
MDAERLIWTLEQDRRLIRSLMRDRWPEFAARVAEVTARFEGVTTEEEVAALVQRLLSVCQEYAFVQERLALAEKCSPTTYRLPKPKPEARRELDSLANRFMAFGKSIEPRSAPRRGNEPK